MMAPASVARLTLRQIIRPRGPRPAAPTAARLSSHAYERQHQHRAFLPHHDLSAVPEKASGKAAHVAPSHAAVTAAASSSSFGGDVVTDVRTRHGGAGTGMYEADAAKLDQPNTAAAEPPIGGMLGMESGDLRLGDFMEEVKNELWQYNAMPFRRRFRVQSLLRRLQTPKFETWAPALKRPTDGSREPFTRTLLARHEGSPSLHPSAANGFDLLLLCWKPGAMSPIHDHAGSGCWVKVLRGQVSETRYANADPGAGLIETSHVTYGAGTVTYMDDEMGYHKMGNASKTEECISLHLCSPGIVECTTWEDTSSTGKPSRVKLDDSFVFP